MVTIQFSPINITLAGTYKGKDFHKLAILPGMGFALQVSPDTFNDTSNDISKDFFTIADTASNIFSLIKTNQNLHALGKSPVEMHCLSYIAHPDSQETETGSTDLPGFTYRLTPNVERLSNGLFADFGNTLVAMKDRVI